MSPASPAKSLPGKSLPGRSLLALASLALLAACQANTAPAPKAERPVLVQRVAFAAEGATRDFVGVVRARYETDLPVVPGADVRFVSGEVSTHLPAIRDTAGDKDVWLVGGGDLVGQFADAGALDEVHVSIAPVTLGAGAPLLPRVLDSTRLRLDEVSRAKQFINAKYTVVPPADDH